MTDLCDKTATVDVPPEWVAQAEAFDCIGFTAAWNPAPHNVNWWTSPATIYEKVGYHRAAIVGGKVPVTLHKFPCGVTQLAGSWTACRWVTVGPAVPFSPGVLHPTSAAALYVPALAPAAALPPGAVLLKCGLTGRDDFGRTTFPSRCSAAEILLGPGAYRTADGVAHAAADAGKKEQQ